MKTDEYGQVHNSPETYAHLAAFLKSGSVQLFEWVDERMSRFVLMLTLRDNPVNPYETYLYVGLEGYGFYGFPTTGYISWGYVAEKLKVAGGSAEPLADLLNGVLGEIYHWPKKLEQVFAEAEEKSNEG